MLLPRLAMNYYAIAAAALFVVLLLLWLAFRRRALGRWLQVLLPLPLLFFVIPVLVYLITSPNVGWDMMRELYTVMLAGGFAYLAWLLWLWGRGSLRAHAQMTCPHPGILPSLPVHQNKQNMSEF